MHSYRHELMLGMHVRSQKVCACASPQIFHYINTWSVEESWQQNTGCLRRRRKRKGRSQETQHPVGAGDHCRANNHHTKTGHQHSWDANWRVINCSTEKKKKKKDKLEEKNIIGLLSVSKRQCWWQPQTTETPFSFPISKHRNVYLESKVRIYWATN